MPSPAFPSGSFPPSFARGITVLSILAPGLLLAMVWMPAVRQFHAPEVWISDQALEAARGSPSDSVLLEQRDFTVLPIPDRKPAMEVAVAEALLQGRIELPDLPVAPFSVGFAPDDLDHLPPELQLWYASFVVPDFLLAAYTETGREEFFSAAAEFIAAWNAYERTARRPRGALWNDHATSARVRVLAEYWRLYRARPEYDPAVGRALLEQAARYGTFLASPRHFTFSTNHGVMQNLGLLQLGLAFPTLPGAFQYRAVALERLARQFPFFMPEGGVIRENSAGYQAFGLDILAKIFRCMTLLGEPVPASWAERYRDGLQFLGVLRRPDGTLPATGDTDGGALGLYPVVTEVDSQGRAGRLAPYHAPTPHQATTVDPVAGYWVHWSALGRWPTDPAVAQTVATWTRPPAPGHKHADELGVQLWSGGRSWLSAVGYWPYTDSLRSEAESWDGSNAPHLSGEKFLSPRTVRMLGQGAGKNLAAVSLERAGPGDFRVVRQAVQITGIGWIILDFASGGTAGQVQTVWTVGPDVEVSATDRDGTFQASSTTGPVGVRFDFLGSQGTSITSHTGSEDPLAGWHVVRSQPRPVPALVVRQPAGAWLAVIVAQQPGGPSSSLAAGQPQLAPASDVEHWTITIPVDAGTVRVARSAAQIVAEGLPPDSVAPDTVLLEPGPDPGAALARIRDAFDSVSVAYPRFRPLIPYREKASYLVVFLFLGQEVALLLLGRRWPKTVGPLRVASVCCWAGVAGWLHFDYLRSWEIVTPSMGLVPLMLRTARPRKHQLSQS